LINVLPVVYLETDNSVTNGKELRLAVDSCLQIISIDVKKLESERREREKASYASRGSEMPLLNNLIWE
jgi:hypothetical protein